MIERYTLPEMKKIWSDHEKFSTWLFVELVVLKELENKKRVPKGVTAKIKGKAKISVPRIEELENELKHDVIAFTTSIAEQAGESGRYFHYGLTSSDVVDTALSINLVRSLETILSKTEEFRKVLKAQALKYKNLTTIGRTHGVFAEPTSFGLKFLGWYCELSRQKTRLLQAKENIAFGKLSGAVGGASVIAPDIESAALLKMKLNTEPVATQVLPRDRHAVVFEALSNLGSSLERIALELRHLQRSELREVEEDFGRQQKGSSAMPHKKNPISAENITGCARLLRSYMMASSENIALWHERDISHSSVERIIAPDATILCHYMVTRMTNVIKGLRVNKKNVQRNLDSAYGVYFSGHVLLKCVEKGLSREDAYRIVQSAAHHAWDNEINFYDVLWKKSEIQKVFTKKELKDVMNVERYLKNIDKIYTRAFKVYK